MSGHIGKLFSKMYYENDDNAEATSVSPTVFNQAHGRIHPDFDGSMQQDPADFLRQVLEHLDEEDRVTAYPQSGEKSVVESTIQGQLSVTVS